MKSSKSPCFLFSFYKLPFFGKAQQLVLIEFSFLSTSSSSICFSSEKLKKMFENLYNIPFLFLEPPNLKLKRLSVPIPSSKTIFFFVITSYFLILAGIIYDIIVEPPSIGSTVENGHSKPVAFLPYRVNGQYIMEGLASSFLFTIGGKNNFH